MKLLAAVTLWLLALGLAGYALTSAPIEGIIATLRHLTPAQLIALTALNAAIVCLFALRWWLLLRQAGHRLPFFAAVRYRLTAFGVSYFTPGPQFGGEPVQVLAVTQRHGVPPAAALSALSLDKVLELLANFTFLALGALLIAGRMSLSPRLVIGALLLAALPWGYLLGLYLGARPLSALSAHAPRGIARLTAVIQQSETEIARFCRRQPLALSGLMLLSALVWVALVGEYALMLRFLGAPLSGRQVLTFMVAARLAFLTPLPGGLGALEAGQVLAAEMLGLNSALGLSVGLLIRARDIAFGLLGLLGGGALLGTSNSSPHDV
ncbi:MAG: UPF0104 family protein [Anaerolineae bacterium]|nr:MAG: UPF0104 family protein [Anaerolineae bacterium]